MKKNFAIYLVLFSSLFAGVSCSDDDDKAAQGTPYASILSYNIGNLNVPFYDYDVEGNVVAVEKLVAGEEFEFVIDNKAREVYNIDSLTYGTRVNKVTATLTCEGKAYRFDPYSGSYVSFLDTDSVDYTNPVDVYVESTDGSYRNHYTIKLNVHQVNPDLFSWKEYLATEIASISPKRLLEKDGNLYLFGNNATGDCIVAVSPMAEELSWTISTMALSGADLSSMQLFNDAFYVVVGGDLYSSFDALSWTAVSQGINLKTLLAANDGGMLWAATADEILSSEDGVTFAVCEPLPEDFPLYGCNAVTYPLRTNKNISRTVLVGYSDVAKTGNVYVWSKLSTEEKWSLYDNESDNYRCPSIKDLVVFRYNDALYAFGGAGAVADETIEPFSAFYISEDNGLSWEKNAGYNEKFPDELKGKDTEFVAMVSSDNYIWVVTPTGVWKGILNRLNF